MKTTINYSKSPAKAFDAVEDIKSYLSKERFDKLSPLMAKVTEKDQFAFYASFAGIEGYPVQAWYDLYHGQGAWERNDK